MPTDLHVDSTSIFSSDRVYQLFPVKTLPNSLSASLRFLHPLGIFGCYQGIFSSANVKPTISRQYFTSIRACGAQASTSTRNCCHVIVCLPQFSWRGNIVAIISLWRRGQVITVLLCFRQPLGNLVDIFYGPIIQGYLEHECHGKCVPLKSLR